MAKKLLSSFNAALCYLLLGTGIIYGQCPSSVSISSSEGNTICQGTSVNFTANVNGGTGTLTYQWQINEQNTYTGTQFTTSSLINGDRIKVIVTSSDNTSCSTSSSVLTMTVNTNQTPTVSLTASPSTKCIGNDITFTATNTNGGSNPTYDFYVNGSSSPSQSSTSKTFTTSSLPEGNNTVRVVMTSSLSCTTSPTAEKSIDINITPDATIDTPTNKDQSVCINSALDPIVFSIGGSGTGASVTGLPAGLSGSFSAGNFTINGTPTVAGDFPYTVTTTGPCGQTSETGTITVNKNATISLTSSNAQQEVCQGEAISNITYSIGETGNDAEVTGLPTGISGSISGDIFTIQGSSTVTGTYPYTISATGSCGNSSSLTGSITINENLVPAVSISSSDADNIICDGTAVTFTATPTNGGSSPSYQWKVNEAVQSATGATFTTSDLTDGQSVTVEMTTTVECYTESTATSNAIATTVNPNLTPDVTIEVSDSDICSGDTLQFTATPINGGSTPSYQWKIDNSVVGTDSPTFSTSSLTDGQQVTVTLTSSETCLATESATSTPIVMQVNPNLTPEVSISSNDNNNIICAGGSVTFTATPVNGGATPSYQWLVNGTNAGTNSATFTTTSLTDGANVKVVMTSSEDCLAQATAESNEIPIQVDQTISSATPAFNYSNSSHNSTAICPAASGLIYSITPIPGATSYIWTFPNSGWTVTSGANTNQVTVTAGTSAQGGNITVKGVNECGQSQAASISVTTGTAAYVNAGPDQTVCAGTNSIQIAGEIGGVISQGKDFSWSANVNGGTFSDQSGNNTSKKLNPVYTIPSSVKNGGTVTIKITSVSPSGTCPEPKVDEMVLTVLKNATISSPTNKDQTVCINSGITTINYTITDAGTGATVTGLPNGLSGTYNNGTFNISGAPTQTGTFGYTVTTTGNCTNQQTSASGTITVTPDQTISDPANKSQVICINEAINNILFTTNQSVTGVGVAGLPAGLSGSFSNNSYTITGTATEAGTFDYTVTTSGNCISTSQSGSITIKPDPTISDPTNKTQEVCISTAIAPVEFSISEPGSGASATGLPTGVTGNFANGVFTLSGTPSEAGTFDYTITTTGDCVQVSQTGQFIVNPDPTAEISYSGDLCESQTSAVEVSLSGTAAYTGGTFSATPSGLNIDAASGAIDPAVSTPGTYTVSYSTPAGCKTATATTDVTIHPIPSVDLSYTSPACNSGSTSLEPIFSNGVGTYQNGSFSVNKTGLTINTSTGIIDATTSSPGDYVITYSIPETNGCDAVSTTANITITQFPQFAISYPGPFCTSEENNIPVNFGSSPKGTYTEGTFSGSTGLSLDENGNINPSTSTPGNHTVTYSVAAANGCPAVEATTSFSIFEKVEITTHPVNTGVCSSSPANFEVVASGDNLSYQWYKNLNGTFTKINGETNPTLNFNNATAVNAGEYQVVVSSTNGACTSVTSNTVTLNVDEDIVIVKPAEDITICEDDYETLSFAYEAHANGAPLTFQWIKDGTPINASSGKYVMTETGPSNTEEGTYTGTLTIQNIDTSDDGVYAVEIDGPEYFTCSEAISKTFTFRVNPRPEKPATSAVEYCLDATPSPLTATKASEENELLWYSYDASTDVYTYLGTSITPTTDVAGQTSYWVTQKQPNGCESDPEELLVTVNEKPEPVATETITFSYCFNEAVSEPLSITPTTGSTINWYDSVNAGTPLGSAPTPKTSEVKVTSYWVSQTLASTGCESVRTQVDININPLPNLTAQVATGYESEICLGSETRLLASGATSYVWTYEGAEVGTSNELTVIPETAGSFTYEVTGTDDNGCINSTQITIDVEEPTDGGVASGPASVCITGNEGTLILEGYLGEILNWQVSNDGTTWNDIQNTTGLTEIGFQNITTDTRYRAVVKNGVCDVEYSQEHLVVVDPEPVAGGLLFKGTERIFMMCEFPTSDYLVPLHTSGNYVGEIVAWQYRRNSATEWATVLNSDDTNYTGDFLSGEQVIAASNNESTIFRVEVQSGACSPNVYSETATLSIIPSDIAPNPVTASPGEICLGEIVTLNAGTGYGGSGTFQGGAFDNSSIANHGWRVMRYPGNTPYTFESAADNVRPDRWMRTNPHDYLMADPDGNGPEVYQRFDSSSGDEGNKGFAIVSGDNPSTLETPVFNLYATDNPVLTFDQAYNLTYGDTIRVEISLDGGQNYVEVPLMEIGGPANPGDAPVTSGNYDRFGDDGLGEPNNMSVDLSAYAGMGNLRIRWLYDGSSGGIYTIDDIGIPQDPDNVQLIWYYDDDLDDPNNDLVQIGDVNQNTVTYTPTKIGWNYFEVQTALVFDTNGDPCQSAENMATIQVYVFDTYTTSATAEIGSCGTSSVPLTGVLEGAAQGVITDFPAEDESTVAWEVLESPDGYTFSEEHFDPSISDPNAVFDPGMGGVFSLQWTITPDEDSPCEPTQNPVQFEILDCTTLDFDGVDDYVDLGNNYTGNYFVEAWIRPFDRSLEDGSGNTNASVGTIFSGPGFEVAMADLTAVGIQKNTRWYHIAVANNGDLWIDGIASGNISKSGHGGSKTVIGAKWNSSDKTTTNHFSGWIEEVRIWSNPPEEREIRFMMNQRLKIDATGTVISPLQGEIVPNRATAGSYLTDGSGNNLHLQADGSLKPFYDQTAEHLAGYYRLISAEPDPDLGVIDNSLRPTNGETPDHSTNKIPGRLYNMTTNQQNTAPLPYISAVDDQTWATDNTWIRPDVWDPPNSEGITGTPIDWNIAITRHHIDSGNKDITLLGLKSEVEDKLITMANPSGDMDETNSGQMMRVTHYLLLNGNMDLVGESQLLQDEGSILAEESAGWLERDQQGKMLSFNYNYWSSPVSAQGAANNADYSVGQVLLDGTDSQNPGDINFNDQYHAADGPRPNEGGIIISNYWIWKFLGDADVYEQWFHIGSTGTLATGEGYTMKGTDGTVGINDQQNYVFKGKPHNGDFTRQVSQKQNYLVGNPYPSAIDAKEFILDNTKDVPGGVGRNSSNIFNGALYFWDHFSGRTHYLERYIGGYATWTLAGGVVAVSNDERINVTNEKGTKEPGQYIPVAQGFFVNTVLDSLIAEISGITVSGGLIQFKNRQRIYQREDGNSQSIFHSQEKKDTKSSTSESSKQASEDTRQKIWLKFSSPMGYHRQLLVTADSNTSSGFDLGYDAPMIEDNEEDMYWYFSNYEFVIQAVEDFNVDRELDLGIKVHEEGKITIAIDDLKNIPDDLEIFLKDSLLQVHHDLRKTAYKATSDTGTYHNRFKVIFKDPTAVVVEEPEVEVPEEGEFEILYVNGSREILVKNPELLNIERIYLNNVLGQQLHVYYDIPAEKEIRLPVKRFSSGVYIVKVHSEKGIRTKKVILE